MDWVKSHITNFWNDWTGLRLSKYNVDFYCVCWAKQTLNAERCQTACVNLQYPPPHKSLMHPLGLFVFTLIFWSFLLHLLFAVSIAVVYEHCFVKKWGILDFHFILVKWNCRFLWNVYLVLWCTIAVSTSWWLTRQQDTPSLAKWEMEMYCI